MRYAMCFDGVIAQLRAKGYEYDWQRGTVKAPDWERGIRLDRLGFTYEVIQEKIRINLYDPAALRGWNSNLPYRPKRFPLLETGRRLSYEIDHSHDTVTVLVDVVFVILLQLLKLTSLEQDGKADFRPLSPSVRAELERFDRLHAAYMLMSENDIHTPEDLSQFITKTERKIKELEHERQLCRNSLRRPKPKEIEDETKRKIAETTEQITPLRGNLKSARWIEERWRRYYEMLKSEREMEKHALQKERNRSR